MLKLVNLRLDEKFLARVDGAAESRGQTRTEFVRRALDRALVDVDVSLEMQAADVASGAQTVDGAGSVTHVFGQELSIPIPKGRSASVPLFRGRGHPGHPSGCGCVKCLRARGQA